MVYSADILHFRQNYVSHIRKTNTSNSNRPHRYSQHTRERPAPPLRRTLKSYSNGGNVIFQCKFSTVSRHASIYQRPRVWRLLRLRRLALRYVLCLQLKITLRFQMELLNRTVSSSVRCLFFGAKETSSIDWVFVDVKRRIKLRLGNLQVGLFLCHTNEPSRVIQTSKCHVYSSFPLMLIINILKKY